MNFTVCCMLQESLFSDATEVDKPELPTVMTLSGQHETDA